MESLMRPDQLRARILVWAEEEIRLNRKATTWEEAPKFL
jgi:hypothetical protein